MDRTFFAKPEKFNNNINMACFFLNKPQNKKRQIQFELQPPDAATIFDVEEIGTSVIVELD